MNLHLLGKTIIFLGEEMKNYKLIPFAICLVLSLLLSSHTQAQRPAPIKGIWVSVFTDKGVLYSKEAALELIDTCKDAGINDIYLQIYQSGKAYYDSSMHDKTKYSKLFKAVDADAIDFILGQAQADNIRVHAWVNLLSLGLNEEAVIVKKHGRSIFTRDQYLRSSGRKNPNQSDEYYLREDQVFLEPGDPRVSDFLLAVCQEIMKRYPGFAGIHLDYVRYPMTVPFIPSSKFTQFGISYGYGQKNIERFKQKTGIDVLKGLNDQKGFALWDDWRRNQITSLVERINRQIKKRHKSFKLSAAVIPSAERAYSSMSQDWPLWLEEGIVDHVVLMNYSKDDQLVKEITLAANGYNSKGKAYVGLGFFLMEDNLSKFFRQYKLVKDLNPEAIVLYSYDSMTAKTAAFLKKN